MLFFCGDFAIHHPKGGLTLWFHPPIFCDVEGRHTIANPDSPFLIIINWAVIKKNLVEPYRLQRLPKHWFTVENHQQLIIFDKGTFVENLHDSINSTVAVFWARLNIYRITYIWSNYSDLTRPGPPKGSVLEGKWDPLFQGNLGWWNIIPFGQIHVYLGPFVFLVIFLKRIQPWDENHHHSPPFGFEYFLVTFWTRHRRCKSKVYIYNIHIYLVKL